MMDDAVKESHKALRRCATEAHWNSTIHKGAIEPALKECPSAGVTSVMRAQMADFFHPRLGQRQPIEVG